MAHRLHCRAVEERWVIRVGIRWSNARSHPDGPLPLALQCSTMPGTELFGEEEKKEVMDVLNTGVLFRYNHDAARKGHWKAKDFEAEMRTFTGAKHALAVSSGSTAVSTMLAAW